MMQGHRPILCTGPGGFGGGFKEPPQNGRVQIACCTAPALVIAAQTLPEENASTSILRKPGFRLDGEVIHPEDGRIREWRL